ncbi:MAG: NMD3-related protein [Liquorilactobacillus hordei]|uniref:NMD3-related protein n=1 Tax=Liquorilactobacillus hordei TaxID=468911 RepID=UPI0039EA4C33
MKLKYEMLVCCKCGKVVPQDSYCVECGKRLVDTLDESENIAVGICVNCGSLTPDKKYCSKCGYNKNYTQLF